VSEIAHQLPTDIEALHALVTAARAERDVAVAERDQALSQMDRLRHLLRRAVLALPEIDEEAGAETGA
jgi:transposase